MNNKLYKQIYKYITLTLYVTILVGHTKQLEARTKLGNLLSQESTKLEQTIKRGKQPSSVSQEALHEWGCNLIDTMVDHVGQHGPIQAAFEKSHLRSRWKKSLNEVIEKLFEGIREGKVSVTLNEQTIDALNALPDDVQDGLLKHRANSSPMGVLLSMLFMPVLLTTSFVRLTVGLPLSMIPIVGNLIAGPFVAANSLTSSIFNFLLGVNC